MTRRWKFLDRLMDQDGSPLGMPSSAYAELATRIHEAVAAPEPAELVDLAAQLEEAVEAARAKAPAGARKAADGSRDASETDRAAHTLGQLGFAYLVVANAHLHRAAEGFSDKVLSGPLAECVTLLGRGEMSGCEMAEALGMRPETISRKLKELRALGAVDFRREGTRFVNFLTPAASTIIDGHASGRAGHQRRISPAVSLWAETKIREQEPIMRDAPSFATAHETA